MKNYKTRTKEENEGPWLFLKYVDKGDYEKDDEKGRKTMIKEESNNGGYF